MQTDVTDIVQRYRLALRYIWNCCIWVDPNLQDWDSVYSFRKVKLPLFKALVGEPLGFEADEIFGERFQVVPRAIHGDGFSSLQINSRVPSSPSEGTWITLTGPFKADEVSLKLIDLFDWSPLGYIDLRYYVVLIESLRGHPDKIGQHALVDVMEAKVLCTADEERVTGNSAPDTPQ